MTLPLHVPNKRGISGQARVIVIQKHLSQKILKSIEMSGVFLIPIEHVVNLLNLEYQSVGVGGGGGVGVGGTTQSSRILMMHKLYPTLL